MGTGSSSSEDDRDPRERILEAATDVFARKGYAGTGVREIAAEANVNQAMVNYYFGGKLKILEQIIEVFLRTAAEMFEGVLESELPRKERLELYIRRLAAFLREHPRKTRIFFSELYLDIPELTVAKAEIIREHLLPRMERLLDDGLGKAALVGPAIVGMVSFHFMITPMLKEIIGVTPNDEFYEKYTESITELALFGLMGRER